MTALFVLTAPSAWAVPPAVINCNDSGTGSLRAAVAGAASGDTIDMSALACGKITLTTGAINVTVNTLTLHGPGRKALTIAGDYATPEHDRIIFQSYYKAGTPSQLSVDNLRVGFGYMISSTGSVYGGCIASYGSVTLLHVGVYYCTAKTTATNPAVKPFPKAFGGGVFAAGGLALGDSVLLHNTATATEEGIRVQGGCAWTIGNFDMRDSVAAYCNATDTNVAGSHRVFGGALELQGSNVTIAGSLIARSYSSYDIGGVDASTAPVASAATATISNSTITENNAKNLVGGLFSNLAHVNINNSTIVRNTAGQYTYNNGVGIYFNAPGVTVISYVPTALDLESSIIANNSAGGTQEDLAIGASKTGVTISGLNNLVRTYKSDVALPSDPSNLTGICPKLGSIRNNGGSTPTHALQSGSPMIDAGNNTAIYPYTDPPAVATYDQRGQGQVAPLYTRVSGPSADIGAYEYQKTDIIFYAEMATGCE